MLTISFSKVQIENISKTDIGIYPRLIFRQATFQKLIFGIFPKCHSTYARSYDKERSFGNVRSFRIFREHDIYHETYCENRCYRNWVQTYCENMILVFMHGSCLQHRFFWSLGLVNFENIKLFCMNESVFQNWRFWNSAVSNFKGITMIFMHE